MRVLGVDPGLSVTGYGIIDDRTFSVVEAGVIRTKTRRPIQERLDEIYSGLSEIITEYRPGVIVLEKIYTHYQLPATAILMGHARGAICLVSGVHRIPLVNYPSTRIKKAVTGNGAASKRQVQRMVQALLKLEHPPEPVDVSDALAMAISFIYTSQHAFTAK